jgi:hypothetical protein
MRAKIKDLYGKKVLKKVKSLIEREPGKRRVGELRLIETDRPLIACIDASRLASTSLGGIAEKFSCLDFVPDLLDAGDVGVKLRPYREGADYFAVST